MSEVKKLRGFAGWDPEKRREAQSRGGSVPRDAPRPFKDRELAKRAGKLGHAARYGKKPAPAGTGE